MTDKPWTTAQFAGKIDWEGGVVAALEYGLKEDVLEDGELKDAWHDLRVEWEGSFSSLVGEVEALIEEDFEDDDD